MGRWFDPSAPLPPSAQVAPVERVYKRILGHMRLFWRGITVSIVLAMLPVMSKRIRELEGDHVH